MNNIKLKVGKWYRMRNGEVTRIIAFDELDPGPWIFRSDSMGWFSACGQWAGGDGKFDLIEEAPDPVAEAVEEINRAFPDLGVKLRATQEEQQALASGHETRRQRYGREEEEDRQFRRAGEREVHADHLRMGRSVRFANYARGTLFALLGVASLVFATRATAREILSMPNNVGGEIILTDVKAKACGDVMRVAIARHPSGIIISGCWTYTEAGYAYVKWGDDVRMYRLDQFNIIEQEDEKPDGYRTPWRGS